jgi:hypothetical protein
VLQAGSPPSAAFNKCQRTTHVFDVRLYCIDGVARVCKDFAELAISAKVGAVEIEQVLSLAKVNCLVARLLLNGQTVTTRTACEQQFATGAPCGVHGG